MTVDFDKLQRDYRKTLCSYNILHIITSVIKTISNKCIPREPKNRIIYYKTIIINRHETYTSLSLYENRTPQYTI